MARPRPTGSGFSPYVWSATVADVARAHGLSPAHVLRFDANLPAFPAPLPIPADSVLADRGEYPEGSYRELREAAAGYAGCAPEEVVVDAGADGLIGLVAKVFLAPGHLAVVERPTYPLYAIASALEGADVREAPRRLAGLAEAARGAHVLWLCNPGNPSGALFRPREIARVADELPETLVCVDEAYFEYSGETVARLALERSNLVCVRTLSKAFALAGLRVGYAVAARPLAAELTARRAPAPVSASAAVLAAAALRRPTLAAEVSATVSERERVRRAFAAAGYDVPLVHANFVVVETADAPALAARLERRGFVLRAYEGALRMTVRSPAEDDLVLAALGLEAPPSERRSAVVFAPGLRVSLVLDGSGRARAASGETARDRRLERFASEAGLDLDLVSDAVASDGEVAAAFGDALSLSLAQSSPPKR